MQLAYLRDGSALSRFPISPNLFSCSPASPVDDGGDPMIVGRTGHVHASPGGRDAVAYYIREAQGTRI